MGLVSLALDLPFFAAFAAVLAGDGGLTLRATQCLVGPYLFNRRRKNWSRVAFLNLGRWRVPTVPPVGAGISFGLLVVELPDLPRTLVVDVGDLRVGLAEGLGRLGELLVELREVTLFDDRPLLLLARWASTETNLE